MIDFKQLSRTFLLTYALFGLVFSAPAMAQDVATKCDVLAASPYDPYAVSEGVEIEQMKYRQAIVACMDALKEDPSSLTYRFQLGRGYLAKGQTNAAIRIFESLQKRSYPAAVFQLAQAHHFGHGTTRNHKHAQIYYQRAWKNGVIYAADGLSRLHGDPQSIVFDIDKSFEWADRFSEANAKAQKPSLDDQ